MLKHVGPYKHFGFFSSLRPSASPFLEIQLPRLRGSKKGERLKGRKERSRIVVQHEGVPAWMCATGRRHPPAEGSRTPKIHTHRTPDKKEGNMLAGLHTASSAIHI